VDFDATGQLILYSRFDKYLRKMGIQCSSALAIFDFKNVYASVRREVLYNILLGLVSP